MLRGYKWHFLCVSCTFLRMCSQLVYERKDSPFKTCPSTIHLFMRSSRGLSWDRKRTRQISQFFPRSAKHPREESRTTPFLNESFGRTSVKVWSQGTTRWWSRRANCRNKKSAETESVYIGIQWLRLNCGFSGRAKMENVGGTGKLIKTKSRIRTDPWRRRIPWKNTDIFYITFCSYSNAFFLLPPLPSICARACFPPPTISDYPFATPFPGWRSHVTWKSNAPLSLSFAGHVKAEFIKICAIKATSRKVYGRDIWGEKHQ